MKINIAVLGDCHNGHALGTYPPEMVKAVVAKYPELKPAQTRYHEWLFKNLRGIGPIDYGIWNGDIPDGEGKRNNLYHFTTNMNEQIKMCSDLVSFVNAKKNIFVYGTPYHTGGIMEYEKEIADNFGCEIKAEQNINIGGKNFHFSHHCNKSGNPTGGDISLKKNMVWTLIQDAILSNEKADIIGLAHAHEFRLNQTSWMTGFMAPAMQLPDKNYYQYARKGKGYYDVGFIQIVLYEDGDFDIIPHLFDLKIKGRKYRSV